MSLSKGHSAENDAPRLWRVGEPIDYSDPNCTCAMSGMGRKTECRVHGQRRDIPPGRCPGCGHAPHDSGLCEADQRPACNCLTSDIPPAEGDG